MSAYTEQVLVEKLARLSNSQQSIQTLSHWIMYHRKRVKTSVAIWERELINAPAPRKLIFLYLANDIIQTSRKKGMEFVKEFAASLPKTVLHTYNAVDDPSKQSIIRMLDIWADRKVYDPKMIADIKATLNNATGGPNVTAARSALPALVDPSAFMIPQVENKFVTAFAELEQAAVSHRLMVDKVSNIRPTLLSGELLEGVKDQEQLNDLAVELEEALVSLTQFQKSLSDDSARREKFSVLLTELIAQQEALMNEATDALHSCKQKMQQAELVKAKMMELNPTLPPGPKREAKRPISAIQRQVPSTARSYQPTPKLPSNAETTTNNHSENHKEPMTPPTTPPGTPPPPIPTPDSPISGSSSSSEPPSSSQPPLKRHKPESTNAPPPTVPAAQQQHHPPPHHAPATQHPHAPPMHPYGQPPPYAAAPPYGAPPHHPPPMDPSMGYPWPVPPHFMTHAPPPHAGVPAHFRPSVQQPHPGPGRPVGKWGGY